MIADGNGGKRLRLSPEERRERLGELVLRRSKLSPEETVLLREVFPVILELYYDKVRDKLQRRGLGEAVTKELVQEVFFTAFLWIRDNGFPDVVPKLLTTMTHSALLNHLRTRKRDPVSLGLPSSGSAPPLPAPEPERAFDLRRVGALLLDMLSPEHRDVVETVVITGLSYRDAAGLLGIHIGTLKTRLMAAKRVLLDLVEKLLPPSQRVVS